ncbi:hypothetical protein ORI20_04165 [Mycobacterium sp. CVI_P3]|uniref:Uncharacterized protein n=1 Tax=Mycobacterium pinniadriaticum TaxID=2994102 RepID=A0ABT3S8Q9_9MYCO|nr:hypothetical protein [Mycobacterium pinniadriaticum]MCX2929455.1 hypothetical protein [Mycobacterium pinniadriaticum]MCX2935879.1 hypothetical protein [Mycobacterium pinniadriaticum]
MATFWVYLKIQAMCLVFGIVGPIFLFVYFAAQPDPTLRWMYYWGLVITAIDVLVALGLTDQTIRARQATREKESRSS